MASPSAIPAQSSAPRPGAVAPAIGHNRPRFQELHPGVYSVALLGWLGMIGAYWLVFGLQLESAFMVAVSTFFFLVYFSVPAVLLRLAGRGFGEKSSFADFLRGEIETNTGRMGGVSALAQVVIIPVSLACGTAAMGIIISVVR